VVRSAGLSFDGIAVAALSQGGALYVWSDASGLWAKRTGATEGATPPQSPALRLADRCRAGLDAEADERGGAFVACSRATHDDADEASEVVVYKLDATLHASLFGSVGRAGRDGRGVSLAVQDQAVYVAYHDGTIGQHAITLARLDAEGLTRRLLSHAGSAASEPSLEAHGGHVYAAFSELALDAEGAVESAVWLARDDQPARRVAQTRADAATPKLTADARGLVLSYRDRSLGGGARSELYVLRLDAAGRPTSTARAIGRANAEGEPSVHGCGALTTALLPREYGGERFVGINALDGELSSLGAGHQLYETGRDFVLASGACVGGAWLLLAADRATPSEPGVEALALRFQCRD
jgi:hypothetical protein